MSALLSLLLAFAGGLILNLMPCVLPVISIKVISLVRDAREGGVGSLRHGLYFAAGVMVCFLALGGTLVGLRSAGSLLGWGFQFQEPVVVALAAMLFFLIGLNLLGVFDLGSFFTRLGAAGSARGGKSSPALRSFLGGLFAAVVATPCTAPFMGAAIGYALTRPGPAALAVFAALAVGMSAPYVALSALPGLGARLPRPGRWMETLRQALGFPMMAAVVWMLFVFSARSGSTSTVALVGSLLAAAVGAWTWGRWGGPGMSRAGRLAAGVASILIVAGAAGFAVARAADPAASALPAGDQDSSQTSIPDASSWEPWSERRVEELRAQGRPVFVDFTARWCLSCRVNEGIALRNPGVLERFKEKNVATLRADWTERDDQIAGALASFGRAGVPLYVLYLPGSEEPFLLPELLTPAVVLAALDSLG